MRRLVLILVLCLPAFGRTAAEFRSDITDRDRQITELRGEVERLRYAAGDGVAKKPALLGGTPAKLSIAQHEDTIQHLDRTKEMLDGIQVLLADQRARDIRRIQMVKSRTDEETLAHRLQVIMAAAISLQFLLLYLIYQRAGRR